MNHAITMGIFWHLIGAASAACFYAPFKKSKTLVVGNHVVGRGDRLLADSALGHQRHAVTRLLGLLPLF
ncbi:L-rhamnose-proton symporter [Klebsiella pneumoniae]|uniref:L-rhamnose-proton symporter n=1 Tax=Klebsiella pneumoniae TaxID=573 RepID=A0A3S4HTY3_KLEPN|nr:L-rhamnose-proton symporter [Klebsiella pneumoniae]